MVHILVLVAALCISCGRNQRRVHALDFQTGIREQAGTFGWSILEEKGSSLGVSSSTGKAREPRNTSATYLLKRGDAVRTIAMTATGDEITAVTVNGVRVYRGKSVTLAELLALCFPG